MMTIDLAAHEGKLHRFPHGEFPDGDVCCWPLSPSICCIFSSNTCQQIYRPLWSDTTQELHNYGRRAGLFYSLPTSRSQPLQIELRQKTRMA